MTIYNEAIALSKLCELKDSKTQDKKLIAEIFDTTKGLIDLYLEENPIDSNLDKEEARQILAKGLLEAIETYRIDMVVAFSVYAYYKMDNTLETYLDYLQSNKVYLDRLYQDLDGCEAQSSLENPDNIKVAHLKNLISPLENVNVEQPSNSDEILSSELKEFLLSLTEQERENVLRRFNISDRVITIISTELCFEELKRSTNPNKNYK